jgi:hypothetical protein
MFLEFVPFSALKTVTSLVVPVTGWSLVAPNFEIPLCILYTLGRLGLHTPASSFDADLVTHLTGLTTAPGYLK